MASKQFNAIVEAIKNAADHGAAVIALVKGVAGELEQLTSDPVAVKELAGEMHEAAQKLAEHVVGKFPPASAPSIPSGPEETEETATEPATEEAEAPVEEPPHGRGRGRHGR